MLGLEQNRGHFFNWSDTQTLQPLPPLYVSTVDSGNLGGHLLTLRAGLLALADDPLLPKHFLAGLYDSLGLLVETAEPGLKGPLAAFGKLLDSAAGAPHRNIGSMRLCLQTLASNATELQTQVDGSLHTRDSRLAQTEAPEVDRGALAS